MCNQLVRHAIVTVSYDTEHDMVFERLTARDFYWSWMRVLEPETDWTSDNLDDIRSHNDYCADVCSEARSLPAFGSE